MIEVIWLWAFLLFLFSLEDLNQPLAQILQMKSRLRKWGNRALRFSHILFENLLKLLIEYFGLLLNHSWIDELEHTDSPFLFLWIFQWISSKFFDIFLFFFKRTKSSIYRLLNPRLGKKIAVRKPLESFLHKKKNSH